MRKLCGKNEEGSVAVLVALSMTLLFGFTALTMDFGMQASCRQALQNAADAAALAGAADIGAGKGNYIIDGTVAEYCLANGFDTASEDIAYTAERTGKKLKVTISKKIPMGFSTVLTGDTEKIVSATATAEAASIFGACPYAMFAGGKIEDEGFGILINGNSITVDGNIHSNSDINMKNAVLTEGHTATAVRNISPSGRDGWYKSVAIDMPSYSSLEKSLGNMECTADFYGNISLDKSTGFQGLIEEACLLYEASHHDQNYKDKGLVISVHGSVTFRGNNSTVYDAEFPIILIADGNIDMNGSSLASSPLNPAVIISRSGNITVNGGGADFTGIIYAPNGDVILNGSDAVFNGSIIARNIRKNGGKITVKYTAGTDRYLPDTKVFLVE